MQFLLLLSALLSAFTGLSAGPRVDQVRMEQAEAQVVALAPPAARRHAEAQRPAQPCAAVPLRTGADAPKRPALAPAAPLASVCLIE